MNQSEQSEPCVSDKQKNPVDGDVKKISRNHGTFISVWGTKVDTVLIQNRVIIGE